MLNSKISYELQFTLFIRGFVAVKEIRMVILSSICGILNRKDTSCQLKTVESVRECGYIFTNPSARAGYNTRSISKRSLTGLNSEFSFSQTSSLTKAEEHSLPYYLPITGGRIIGFIPFPRVLVLCEMQSVSPRI